MFDYDIAFSRNFGFISSEEQSKLKHAKVAIAGLGGTGGAQAHALARMGIGAFNIADPDVFELVNFNRQIGATMASIGRPKTEVVKEIIHGINPEAVVSTYTHGVDSSNIDRFLEGVDVVVDSLDFYCFKERLILYAAARARGLWVITAPPLGFGFTLLSFDPAGMSFPKYFGFRDGMTEREYAVALIAGLAPKLYFMRYMRRTLVSIAAHKLPSVAAAPMMIAGAVTSEVVKIITGIGKITSVPSVHQFDALLYKFNKHTYYFGANGIVRRIRAAIINRMLPR